MLSLTGFSVSVVRSLLQKIPLKRDPRDGEYGDDLDDLNGAHAQVSSDSWRVLSCAYAFILTFGRYQFLFRTEKLLVESFWISLGILPFDLLL